MIRAIVFDCFGVLATDGWLPFRDKHFKSNNEVFAQVDRLNKQMDVGTISYPSFVREIAVLAGVTAEEVDKHIDSNVPNAELLKFINTELKPKYKIGMLSNAGANWLDIIFTKAQLTMFDAVALSYEIGAIKPDHRAYEAITRLLNLPAGDCVFIDDQERYCIGAREAGMEAIKYTSIDQLKLELINLLEQD